MLHIQAGQIKAARAMLDWTREDLAAATGLSLHTIRNLESGVISPRHTTNSVIRQVIESKGIEFTEHEGVRRRPTDLILYRGHESCDQFFGDLLQTVRQRGGDTLAVSPSPSMLLKSIGASERNIDRLQELTDAAGVKCLLSECREPSFLLPLIQFRAVSKVQLCASPYFVYGDRLALVMVEGAETRFMIIKSLNTARHWAGQFLDLWKDAVPLLAQITARRA